MEILSKLKCIAIRRDAKAMTEIRKSRTLAFERAVELIETWSDLLKNDESVHKADSMKTETKDGATFAAFYKKGEIHPFKITLSDNHENE